MKKKETYNAQALAIIMVVLVISSIIGFSVSSRLMTQKKAIIDERNSNEALEVTDIILDNMLLSKPEEWATVMEEGKTYIQTATNREVVDKSDYPEIQYPEEDDKTTPPPSGVSRPPDETKPVDETKPSDETKPGKDPVTQLLMKKAYAQGEGSTSSIFAITERLNHPLDFNEIGICPLTEENGNQYTLKLTKTDNDTKFWLRPGETFTFAINGRDFGRNCRIEVSFPAEVDTKLGFVINKTYFKADGSGAIRAYDYDDTTSYCFQSTAGNQQDCDNSSFQKNWTVHKLKDTLILPVDQSMDTIQLTSVSEGPDLQFHYSMPNCNYKLQLWQLRASATCGDAHRAKEVIVPDVSPSFSIFNYVILNGLGELTTASQ